MRYSKNCMFCANRAIDDYAGVLGTRLIHKIPVCGAHADALVKGDGTMVLRSADLTSAINLTQALNSAT